MLLLDMAAEGRCVARIDDKVYFVEGGVPGDRVDLLVEKDKKTYAEARVYRLREPSPDRTGAFCSHFGVCGGCKWQNLAYTRQLELKTRQVQDAFRRIGKVEAGKWHPILPSPHTRYYRNKLEFTFSHQRWLYDHERDAVQLSDTSLAGLGFHIPGRFDKVLDVETCYLQEDPSNAIRNWVKAYTLEKGFRYFDLREQTGFFRNLVLRNNSRGEWMVLVLVSEDRPGDLFPFLEALSEAFPSICSLYWVLNRKRNDAYSDLEPVLFKGEPWLEETMEDLLFRIGPTSFYQTNPEQALSLYRITAEMADAGPEDVVYDLYTGTGTIALFLARRARKVVGIEYVEAAVADARANAARNGLHNTAFFSGDMARLLSPGFVEENGRPDVVVTDPPRAGMHPGVVAELIRIMPRRIVYVSCNPATQARDLALLNEAYSVTRVQPVDMFPHTHHVENVALLERR